MPRPWPPCGRRTSRCGRPSSSRLERLRYQARLAERQFNQADPDNRLVTAELERRWEAALRELKEAEETFQREQQQPPAPEALSPEEREAFLQAGRKIPELWRQGLLSPQQQKAFLRCLIDKVVVHRSAPDTLQVRIVWRGRRHDDGGPAGDGGRPGPPVRRRGDGERDPQTRQSKGKTTRRSRPC